MDTIPTSNIVEIDFSVMGTDSVIADSYVEVKHTDMFSKDRRPRMGGPIDPSMGTFEQNIQCAACHNKKRNCLGHDGHIMLNYPVFNVITFEEMLNWLRIICFKCKYPIVDIKKYKTLDSAAKSIKTQNKVNKACSCKEWHPILKRDKRNKYMILAVFNDNKGPSDSVKIPVYKEQEGRILVEKRIIFPHFAGDILAGISDDVVRHFKRTLDSHPRNFVLNAIKVPPVSVRPDSRNVKSGKASMDDLTAKIIAIVNENNSIEKNDWLEGEISRDLKDKIYRLNDLFVSLIRETTSDNIAKSNQPQKSIILRIKGKGGMVRKVMLGKRVFYAARSTITGCPTIEIDEIGIPIRFARNLQVEEVMTSFNRSRLMEHFNNGVAKWPGATKLVKKYTGKMIDLSTYNENIIFEIGDTLHRDLVDGDVVTINRQPSLKPSNIGAHRVKVIRNESVLTFLINVMACPLYDADFDGDQMNIYIHTSAATRSEVADLSKASNWLVSHSYSDPLIGQVDDSVIGLFILTRSDVRFNKRHMISLFTNCKYFPTFDPNKDEYTGRDAITEALRLTPVTFFRKPSYYQPERQKAGHIQYDPSEISVEIIEGVHKRGVLDKSSIGKGSPGSLHHIIAHEYGTDQAFGRMFDLQQIANNYIHQKGFTVGIMDMLVDAETEKVIQLIESQILKKALLIVDDLNAGKILPPPDKTIEETYEQMILGELKSLDAFADPIFAWVDFEANGLMQLIMSGSKGSPNHIYHMASAIGQIVINGDRPKANLSYMRSSCRYPRYDMHPRARGYVSNSYMRGLTSSEYSYSAQNGRFDIISKALSTSVTGESNRKSIKCMESAIINLLGECEFNGKVIQQIYGDDGLDPRSLIKIRIESIMISNDALNKKYNFAEYIKGDGTIMTPEGSIKISDIFAEEFSRIKSDREEYVKIYQQVEDFTRNETLSDEKQVPVDIDRVIKNHLLSAGIDIYNIDIDVKSLDEKRIAEIAEMVYKVKKFCDGMVYVITNRAKETNNGYIPETYRKAVWMFSVYSRTVLCAKKFLHKMTNDILDSVLSFIRYKYATAAIAYGTTVGIIAAQAFSAPLTQYMLDAHHRAVSGGTSKKVMDEVKDVLAARDTEKMSNPQMYLQVLDEYSSSEAKVREIANNIEMMQLGSFVDNVQVFYEEYGIPVHPQFVNEAKTIIERFAKANPLTKINKDDYRKHVIRFELKRRELIHKNMTVETIAMKLTEDFPDFAIVYTPESASKIVFRIYIRNDYFKKGEIVDKNTILTLWEKTIFPHTIRGVDGIKVANVIGLVKSEVAGDGSVQPVKGKFAIQTEGINFQGVMRIAAIDPTKIYSNSIVDTNKYYGIEATRQMIIYQMRRLGAGGLNFGSLSIYSDIMTSTGKISSIERQGVSSREESNALLRMGYADPMKAIIDAAKNSTKNEIKGLTSSLCVGTVPRDYGTRTTNMFINYQVIKENISQPDEWIDEMGAVKL